MPLSREPPATAQRPGWRKRTEGGPREEGEGRGAEHRGGAEGGPRGPGGRQQVLTHGMVASFSQVPADTQAWETDLPRSHCLLTGEGELLTGWDLLVSQNKDSG